MNTQHVTWTYGERKLTDEQAGAICRLLIEHQRPLLAQSAIAAIVGVPEADLVPHLQLVPSASKDAA